MSLLTAAVDALPSHVGHRLAALLGFAEVHAMFCRCCPEWEGFGTPLDEDTETEVVSTLATENVL